MPLSGLAGTFVLVGQERYRAVLCLDLFLSTLLRPFQLESLILAQNERWRQA